MNTPEMIEHYKVIGICRKIYGDNLLRLAHALYDGGLRLLEVTFDQQDADCCLTTANAISSLCKEFGEEMHIGAGTVLSKKQVDVAKAAGAKYIISPNTNIDIIRYTKQLGLVSIPGAMTPTEIVLAHESGADFVKLFPANALGLAYLKDIMAPISHVKIIATAGINQENIQQYLGMGVVGAGISGIFTDAKLIQEGSFAELTRRTSKLMRIVSAT